MPGEDDDVEVDVVEGAAAVDAAAAMAALDEAETAETLPGRGEKLPGALCCDRDGCIAIAIAMAISIAIVIVIKRVRCKRVRGGICRSVTSSLTLKSYVEVEDLRSANVEEYEIWNMEYLWMGLTMGNFKNTRGGASIHLSLRYLMYVSSINKYVEGSLIRLSRRLRQIPKEILN